ncbi:MAG: zinc ABC transporter substrate-binding protein [Patescibacteria group bacterium]
MIHTSKRIKIIAFAFALLIVASGGLLLLRRKETASVPQPPVVKRLKVVTTILPLYLTAREVGGPLVDVVNLIPLTAQPHGYLLTEEDIRNLEDADIVITSGTTIDAWADEALKILDPSQVSILPVGKRLELKPQLPLLAGGKASGELDEHFWLDPGRMILAVSSIRDAISEKNPPHKDQYWVQTSFFLETLGMIDRDFRERFKGAASTRIVSSHLSMAHFISSFDLVWVGAIAAEPDEAPIPAHADALVRRMRADKVRAIFSDSLTDEYALKAAKESGANLFLFDNLEVASTTPESYETIMRRNMMTMSRALGYQPVME